MAHSSLDSPFLDNSARRQRHIICLLPAIFLLSTSEHVYAEAGERIVTNDSAPARAASSATIEVDDPIVDAVSERFNSPHVEISRGISIRDALVKRWVPRVVTPPQIDVPAERPDPPNVSAPPVKSKAQVAQPSNGLIQEASAAEIGTEEAFRTSVWRRTIGSSYAV